MLGQLCGLECHYPHSTDEEIKALKNEGMYPSSRGWHSELASYLVLEAHHSPLLLLPWFIAASSLTPTITAPPLPVSAFSFIPVHTSQLWSLSSLLKTLSGFSVPTDKVRTLSHVFKTLCHLLPMYICLYPYFRSPPALHVSFPATQSDCRSLQMLHMSPHSLFLCLFSPLLPSLSSSLLLSLGITSKALLCPPLCPWVDFAVPPQGFRNPLLWPSKRYSTGVWLPGRVSRHQRLWDHLCHPRPHSGPDPHYVLSKYLLDG